MKRLILLLLAIVSLYSCAPKVQTSLIAKHPALATTDEIVVLDVNDSIPAGATELGEVKITDAGMTVNCNFTIVVERAKVEARKAGGNLLKITKHTAPDLMSSCHRITAKILRFENANSISKAQPLVVASQKNPAPVVKTSKLILGVHGGFSTRVNKVSSSVPADLRNYIKELKTGYHYTADLAYFWRETIGAGFKYSAFRSQNSMNNVYAEDPQTHQRVYGSISDNIFIDYFAPTFYMKHNLKDEKLKLIGSISMGYLGYLDRSSALNKKYKISGGTFGLGYDLGAEIKMSKKLSFGITLSAIAGTLTSVKVKDGSVTTTKKLGEEEREGLARIDFSGGFRYSLKK